MMLLRGLGKQELLYKKLQLKLNALTLKPIHKNPMAGKAFPNFKKFFNSSTSSLLLIKGKVPPACLHILQIHGCKISIRQESKKEQVFYNLNCSY